MKFLKLNSLNYFFIFLILFLLLQGVYSFYKYKISFYLEFIKYSYSSNISPLIWNENGIVEYLQVIFLLFAILNLIILLKKKEIYNVSNYFLYFIYLYFIGIIYFFLEEISWGQQIFHWESSNFFKTVNKQQETNFHNISNLLNQFPRSLLIIWCSLSFIIFKYLHHYKNLQNFSLFIFPNILLKKISLLIILFVVPNLLLKKLNLYIEYPTTTCPIDCYFYPYPVEYIESFEIMNLLTFNFIKLSELQELLFTYYILIHSFLINRLKFIKNSS